HGDDQAGGGSGDAAERRGNRRQLAVLCKQRAEHQDDREGRGHQAQERRDRPGRSSKAGADAHRHVDDVGPGKNLAQAQHLAELLVAQPATLLDQHPPRPGHHAAEAGGADLREADEQLPDARPRLAHGFFLARGCAASYAFARCWKSRCVYTCVVAMLECPSISCTARRSPDDCSTWVANECRSMCGCTCWGKPSLSAHCDSACRTEVAPMRLPRAPTNSAASSGRASGARRPSQASSASRALLPTGTVRVFAPLPVTVTSPWRRMASVSPRSRLTSSASRRPEE